MADVAARTISTTSSPPCGPNARLRSYLAKRLARGEFAPGDTEFRAASGQVWTGVFDFCL